MSQLRDLQITAVAFNNELRYKVVDYDPTIEYINKSGEEVNLAAHIKQQVDDSYYINTENIDETINIEYENPVQAQIPINHPRSNSNYVIYEDKFHKISNTRPELVKRTLQDGDKVTYEGKEVTFEEGNFYYQNNIDGEINTTKIDSSKIDNNSISKVIDKDGVDVTDKVKNGTYSDIEEGHQLYINNNTAYYIENKSTTMDPNTIFKFGTSTGGDDKYYIYKDNQFYNISDIELTWNEKNITPAQDTNVDATPTGLDPAQPSSGGVNVVNNIVGGIQNKGEEEVTKGLMEAILAALTAGFLGIMAFFGLIYRSINKINVLKQSQEVEKEKEVAPVRAVAAVRAVVQAAVAQAEVRAVAPAARERAVAAADAAQEKLTAALLELTTEEQLVLGKPVQAQLYETELGALENPVQARETLAARVGKAQAAVKVLQAAQTELAAREKLEAALEALGALDIAGAEEPEPRVAVQAALAAEKLIKAQTELVQANHEYDAYQDAQEQEAELEAEVNALADEQLKLKALAAGLQQYVAEQKGPEQLKALRGKLEQEELRAAQVVGKGLVGLTAILERKAAALEAREPVQAQPVVHINNGQAVGLRARAAEQVQELHPALVGAEPAHKKVRRGNSADEEKHDGEGLAAAREKLEAALEALGALDIAGAEEPEPRVAVQAALGAALAALDEAVEVEEQAARVAELALAAVQAARALEAELALAAVQDLEAELALAAVQALEAELEEYAAELEETKITQDGEIVTPEDRPTSLVNRLSIGAGNSRDISL